MEAADPTTTSSKVIVQCSDPYGLFDRILPEFQARQPLGKLHWKSASRPLRSINTLNISFIREERKDESANSTRRHQIPGLRQTPFVKILLLRCDDKEIYKETSRRDIKQWLKTQGAPTDSKAANRGQEGHDAFECLILHVVLPNTPAAEQPKSSKHLAVEVNESTDSLNNKSKWTSKSSSTIYDKLRADFSNSSKAAFERVVQVRLTDGNLRSGSFNHAEIAELWLDFVNQLKAAILASFDLRVAQYEADIRDRDAQRSLPGWNFCTFFILKEGLARGFENVGLLEDALTVYDELDAGLDDIVRGNSLASDADSAGALLPFSNDLKPAIRSALDEVTSDDSDADSRSSDLDLSILMLLEQNDFPFNVSQHDYQHRILTNQVSALDLRNYVFTKKLHLLFRKSRLPNIPNKTNAKIDIPEMRYDVNEIAYIIEKSLDFVSFGARALYRDLHIAWGGRDGLNDKELSTQEQVIGNMVASWKFSAFVQILHDCQLSSLLSDVLTASGTKSLLSNGHDLPEKHFPSNSFSITNGGSPTNSTLTLNQLEENKETRRQSTMIPLQQTSQQHPRAMLHDPRERLALWTSELMIRIRAAVVEIDPEPARICNLKRSTKLKGHHLNAPASGHGDHTKAGLRSPSLKLVSSSSVFSISLFRLLTLLAYQSCLLARQTQASRQLLLNLAELELAVDSPNEAANWLQEIPSLLDIEVKTITDLSVLRQYYRALRTLNQPDALIQCLLALLKACSSGTNNVAMARVVVDVQEILDELVTVASQVPQCIKPFHQLFTLHSVDRSIRHEDLVDGFMLTLSVSLNVPCELHASQGLSLTLTALEQTGPKRVVLENQMPIVLSMQKKSLTFTSRTITFGWYDFESISLSIGNLTFRYDFKAALSATEARSAVASSPIMLYPRAGALGVDLKASIQTDLTQTRKMQVTIGGNDTDLENVLVRLKPATAGCRLNTQAVDFPQQNVPGVEVISLEDGNAMQCRSMKAGSSALINVPYSMENPMATSMAVRLDISFECGGERFLASYTESMDPVLPVTVNVQDIFQTGAFFFRFTASSATIVPVTIVRWEIGENGAFEISRGSALQRPILTLPRLPTSWVARIDNKPSKTDDAQRIPLTIHYECLDEKIQKAVIERFIVSLPMDLAFASTVFTKHLSRQIPKLWNEADLEQSALQDEMRLWSFEEMNWNDALRALNHHIRAHAESWLRAWHQQHTVISLGEATGPTRTLKLLVDMPQPALIISTHYILPSEGSDCIIAGQPVSVEVVVQCRRYTSDALEIQYEVAGSNDTWLVGGRKRSVLSSSMNDLSTAVLLIAQRTGNLLLPSIEIRVRRAKDSDDAAIPSFEVEHKSQSETVLAMAALQSTTIALSASSANGGYVVTDAHHHRKMVT